MAQSISGDNFGFTVNIDAKGSRFDFDKLNDVVANSEFSEYTPTPPPASQFFREARNRHEADTRRLMRKGLASHRVRWDKLTSLTHSRIEQSYGAVLVDENEDNKLDHQHVATATMFAIHGMSPFIADRDEQQRGHKHPLVAEVEDLFKQCLGAVGVTKVRESYNALCSNMGGFHGFLGRGTWWLPPTAGDRMERFKTLIEDNGFGRVILVELGQTEANKAEVGATCHINIMERIDNVLSEMGKFDSSTKASTVEGLMQSLGPIQMEAEMLSRFLSIKHDTITERLAECQRLLVDEVRNRASNKSAVK